MIPSSEALHLFENYRVDHSFDIPTYERKRYLIKGTAEWEVILMAWGSMAQTPIHMHNLSCCWTRVLQGRLVERVFSLNPELLKVNILEQSGKSYIDDDIGPHQVLNLEDRPALSLHLYAAPIQSCQVFDAQSGLWKLEPSIVTHSWTG